jgi:hypothetical protein
MAENPGIAPRRAPSDNIAEDARPEKDRAKPADAAKPKEIAREIAREIGGPKGPEPTRYGDWERNGRVSDF